MYQVIDDEATKLANEHIEWFLSLLRPLLFSHFVHGFKHGVESVDMDGPDDRKWNPDKTGQIAERLFTNGAGKKAQRLILELPGGSHGGGWCKQAVMDVINDILKSNKNP